jgi:hypothetical protein
VVGGCAACRSRRVWTFHYEREGRQQNDDEVRQDCADTCTKMRQYVLALMKQPLPGVRIARPSQVPDACTHSASQKCNCVLCSVLVSTSTRHTITNVSSYVSYSILTRKPKPRRTIPISAFDLIQSKMSSALEVPLSRDQLVPRTLLFGYRRRTV